MVLSDDFSLASSSHSNPINNFRRRRKIWRNSATKSSQYLRSQDVHSTETTSIGSSDCFSHNSSQHTALDNSIASTKRPGSIDYSNKPLSNKGGNNITDKLKHNRQGKTQRGSGNRQHQPQLGYSKRGRPYSKELPRPPARAWTYLPEYDGSPTQNDFLFNDDSNEYFASQGIIYTTEPTSHSTSSNGVTPTEAKFTRNRADMRADNEPFVDENGFYKDGCCEKSVLSATSAFGFNNRAGDDSEEKGNDDPGTLDPSVSTIIIVNTKEGLVRAVSDRYDD